MYTRPDRSLHPLLRGLPPSNWVPSTKITNVSAMTTREDEHKRTVRKYPEAVASGDLEVIDDICTEDVVSHAPLGDPRGREAPKEYEAPIHEALPNFDVTFEDLVAEDDRVAMRLTIRGTHEGEMMGIAPTGNRVEFQNVIFHRMEDGKIAERWVQPDVLGLLQQLGGIDDPVP